MRFLTLGAFLFFLSWRGTAQQSTFAVGTVKLNTSGQGGGSMGPREDTFFGKNVTLKSVLMYAYTPANAGLLLNQQIVGGPAWIDADHFDIQAKTEGGLVLGPNEARTLLQSLLKDRFQLKAHREKREMPVYTLVQTKSRLKLSKDQTPPPPSFIDFVSEGQPTRELPRGAVRMTTTSTGTILTGTAIAVSMLVSLLQGRSDRIIVDQTGFEGLIDVNLEFSQDAGTEASSAPLVFTALQDMGLKLESAKAPLDVLVIDSVQRPSEN
ncbi:MAG: TIGR03435 family protein [Bryobacteraceae bacterium]